MDAVHAAGDPGDQDTEAKEETCPQVRALDGVLDGKFGGDGFAGRYRAVDGVEQLQILTARRGGHARGECRSVRRASERGARKGGGFPVPGGACTLGVDEVACRGVRDEDFGGDGSVETVALAVISGGNLYVMATVTSRLACMDGC